MSKKLLNKRILTGFQILMAIAANGYVLVKFFSRGKHLFEYDFGWSWYLVFAVLLMPVNYFLEARKWQVLMSSQRKVDLVQSFFIVLRSVPYGVLTPWRVGEWYGRAEMEQRKIESSVLAALGGYIQQLATVSFGVLGVVEIFGFSRSSELWLLVVFMVLLGYFWVKKAYLIWPKFEFLKHLNLWLYLRTAVWAFLRFLIFSLQYVLVLKFAGVKADLAYLFYSVWVIYLSLNVLPLSSFTDFGVRSGVAIFLLGKFGNVLTISLAGLLVWAINIGLSTVLGSLLIMQGAIVKKQV